MEAEKKIVFLMAVPSKVKGLPLKKSSTFIFILLPSKNYKYLTLDNLSTLWIYHNHVKVCWSVFLLVCYNICPPPPKKKNALLVQGGKKKIV